MTIRRETATGEADVDIHQCVRHARAKRDRWGIGSEHNVTPCNAGLAQARHGWRRPQIRILRNREPTTASFRRCMRWPTPVFAALAG